MMEGGLCAKTANRGMVGERPPGFVRRRRSRIGALYRRYSRAARNVCLDAAFGRPLRNWRRLLAYALFAFSPELWRSVLLFGHIEQPILLWLTLAAVRIQLAPTSRSAKPLAGQDAALRRVLVVGALLGLALLTRGTAILYLLPVVCVAWRRDGWLAGVVMAAVAFGVAALGPAP